MSQSVSLRSGLDPVITAVLDQIVDLAQIDPSSVTPDERLTKDVGMERLQVQMLVFKSAQTLGLSVPFESCRIGDMSCREIVSLLKTWQASGSQAS
jgi:hypothetical protein